MCGLLAWGGEERRKKKTAMSGAYTDGRQQARNKWPLVRPRVHSGCERRAIRDLSTARQPSVLKGLYKWHCHEVCLWGWRRGNQHFCRTKYLNSPFNLNSLFKMGCAATYKFWARHFQTLLHPTRFFFYIHNVLRIECLKLCLKKK